MPSLTFFWPVFAFSIWFSIWTALGTERMRKFLVPGIINGFVLALAIQIVGVSILRLWEFPVLTAGLPLLGVPLLLPFTYIAEVIGFLALLPRDTVMLTFYIAAVSLANALVSWILVQAGIQRYINWSVLGTFLVAVAGHLVAYAYIRAFRPERL